MDETAFLRATARHHTQYVTGMVDVRTGRLLDVVPGRSGTVLFQWVSRQEQGWRDGITVAALDPFRGYPTALRTSLPEAFRVLDAFHVTRLGFTAVDDVRRRVQQEATGHRGRRDDPLFRIRRLLRRGQATLTQAGFDRIVAGLAAGDVGGQIGTTWVAAQDLHRIYHRAATAEQAQRALHAWFELCADSGVPELHRLARTNDAWRPEFIAYLATGGISNGPTEAVNLQIKKVKRTGHGFRNFTNYRLLLLLHLGIDRHTQLPTRIRSRLPRLVA